MEIVYFLAGVLVGIMLILTYFWLIARTLKPQSEKEHKDDWWKRGEPPPY